MKVSYRWLSDYVDLTGYSASDLADKLTKSGVEVDAVEQLNKGVQGVVVGYVKTKTKHPDADKLNVCTVDVGAEEDLQIVCGAANVAAGQKVPVAMIGAKLPDGLVIKRAKLRGVESQGMICSAKELAINDKYLPKDVQEGILVLPEETVPGSDILEVLGLNDEVLDLDLTPNRSDCLSLVGTAYEIAAILGRSVKLPDAQAGLVEEGAAAAEQLDVTVSAADACELYTLRIIKGVKVAPSPLWLQYRLMAAGIRPISNVVDITNYVLLEYGQPLHAFDAAKLAGGRIDVRYATEGEKLVTLDGLERTLTSSMLLITDAEGPVGIAGVMGGLTSEVTADTVDIALESAKFFGPSIRRTSRQLGLRSEASLRFEKGVNREAVAEALDRATALICQYAGGKAAPGSVEVASAVEGRRTIALSLTKVNEYLGTTLTAQDVQSVLERLHFDFTAQPENEELLQVTVPGRRGDIERDVDLIEEVARLYGYDRIPTSLMTGVTTPGSLSREQQLRRNLRNLLALSGLHEQVTYSFVHPGAIARYPGAYADSHPVALAMPMSEDRSVLRTSLIPQLLEAARYNRNRGVDDLALFEIGKVFLTSETTLTRLPEEKQLLAILLTGNRTGAHWSGKPVKYDFYDLKGIVDKAVYALGLGELRYQAAQPAGLHPGRTAELYLLQGDSEIWVGRIGQLHPELQAELDLEDTYVLELELDTLISQSGETVGYRALPRYPAAVRDIAVLVGEDVPAGELLTTARKVAGALLESSGILDIYTGERLGEGRKSVALTLTYRNPDQTLTDEEVSEVHGRVLAALEQSFAAELRK
jgi:phenylalanyl-tRNA synthetase beta chain